MPSKFVSNRDESVPLFDSPWLERLSHVHPAVPALVYGPVIAWSTLRGWSTLGGLSFVGLAMGGVLTWTLVEYVLHRWLFHYVPRSAAGRRLHFLAHGVHHDYPRDSTRLVMPPAVSIPVALVFWWLFRVVAGAGVHAVFAGFVLGYLAYDTLHFAVHHWPMRSRVGAFLKAYHLKHHYHDDHTGYGVTSPLWDVVFRSAPGRDQS